MGISTNSIDRRSFLTASAVAGAALAAGGVSAAYADEAEEEEVAEEETAEEEAETEEAEAEETTGTGVSPLDEDDQFYFDFSTLPSLDEATDDVDVVVVGSGLGGHSAAIHAAEQGLSVIMLEALSLIGGTSNYPEGTYCGACQAFVDAGVAIDDEWIAEDVQEKLDYSHYRADRDICQMVAEGGTDVGNWMIEIGVPFEEVGTTNLLGVELEYVTSLTYDGKGAAAIEVMNQICEESDLIEIRTENTALHLYYDDGTVNGVYVSGPDGEYAIKAKAVILACGGFAGNQDMLKLKTGLDSSRIIDTGMEGAGTGDGLRMAYECGSDQTAVATPGFVWPAIEGIPFYEQASVLACNEMGLWVNQNGKRWINEDIILEFSECCNAILGQQHVWSIIPQNEVDRHMEEACYMGWGTYVYYGSVMTEVQESLDTYTSTGASNAVKADTLEEIAEFIGVDADVLQETVDNYNAMCEAGEDTEFGKDATYMHALEEGPYYAFELYTNAPTTHGGIRINTDCQVLDANFDPIPGLYSASDDNSGLYGDTNMNDPGGMGTSMTILCGMIAPVSAAEYIATL